MDAIHDFIVDIAAIIILVASIGLMMMFVDMEERRENFVIADQIDKSAITLSVNADGGSNTLTATEVRANIVAQPLEIVVKVDGSTVPIPVRENILKGKYNINALASNNDYTVYHVYGADGMLTEVRYNSIH